MNTDKHRWILDDHDPVGVNANFPSDDPLAAEIAPGDAMPFLNQISIRVHRCSSVVPFVLSHQGQLEAELAGYPRSSSVPARGVREGGRSVGGVCGDRPRGRLRDARLARLATGGRRE
jgi:hypothetical protein